MRPTTEVLSQFNAAVQAAAMDVLREIRTRSVLRATMVGQLYPSIVWDEECALREALRTIPAALLSAASDLEYKEFFQSRKGVA